MDLAEIQHAIEELPKDQQAALAAWLSEREQEEWDAEIERDFSTGGLDWRSSMRCGRTLVPAGLALSRMARRPRVDAA